MNKLTVALAQSLVVAVFFAVAPFADDQEALKKDLTAVIALYAASCKDGNKYRVYMNPAGRVVVETRK